MKKFKSEIEMILCGLFGVCAGGMLESVTIAIFGVLFIMYNAIKLIRK